MPLLEYHHVDVFSSVPFSGNSLTVFPNSRGLTSAQMLAITQEMRHFESIFLESTNDSNTVHARVFDLLEELDFAGHPILGAACVLHERKGSLCPEKWLFELKAKTVTVITERREAGYTAILNQGRPEFLGLIDRDRHAEFASALNLAPSCLSTDFPLEVLSTGLRYLIVPLEKGVDRARIVCPNFSELLATVGAQLAYLLDVNALEGRHWNNDGVVEDVATGSGAGTVGAYLAKHHRVAVNQEFILHQGRFVGRPSKIRVQAQGSSQDIHSVLVSGDVSVVGSGTLLAHPTFGTRS